MARRKRSPTSIRWNHRALTQQVSEGDNKCLICTTHAMGGSDPKSPVEKEDYFIDSDGTLTIKNGICPRTLALNLLTELSQNSSRFESDMGKHLSEFILNLEQILKGHNQTCPGETATQVVNAENFIKEYKANQKLLKTQSRKRRLNDTTPAPPNITRTPPHKDIPDNFLAIRDDSGLPTLLPVTVIPELQTSLECDNNNNNEDILGKSILSEGSLSDVAPSPSLSSQIPSPSPSTTSIGMTVAEAAIANKQMANTKRGSKILPVSSSSDGKVKYNCPICSLELSGDHELTVHIRSHNQNGQQTSPNSCTICGKVLSSQSSLDRHMLVHSGERPFRCKICDMSFTTNGNMHRHSRIHQKNGINIKTPGRKPSESKLTQGKSPSSILSSPSPSPSPGPGSQAHLSALMAGYREPEKGTSSRPPPPDQNVEILQYLSKLQQLTMTGSYMYPFATPHHSAFPFSPMVPDPMAYMQAMIDPVTGEPINKRFRLPHRVMTHPREPSPDLRAAKSFKCSECEAEFKNQFSLESHMETHIIVDKELEAEGGATCKKCKTIAKSEESLLLHTLTHHKAEEDLSKPDSSSSPPLSPSNTPASATLKNSSSSSSSKKVDKKEDGDTPMSFMDLGFANFTTKKFPLIAKAFCEDNPDLRGSKSPVYKCQECDKEFPVEGAKDLHEASHVPEEYTRCPKCNCHFSDSSRLQDHMLKHVSDLKFEKSLEEDKDTSMAQNYFLAQFGLITAEDYGNISDDVKKEEEVRKNDMDSDSKSVSPSENESMDISLLDATESGNFDDSQSEMNMNESQILTLPMRADDISKIFHGKSSLPDLDVKEDEESSMSKMSSTGSKTDESLSAASPLFPSSSSRLQERILPPTFQCKHCNVILNSAKAFKHHQNMHKESQQFQCKVCPYSSTDKSTLLRHMRTHSGERPYKCKLCDYSFTTKANCERHLRQKHGLQDKDTLKEKLIHLRFDLQDIIQMSRKTDRNVDSNPTAVCESCGVDFHLYHSLQQHLHNSPDCRMVFACRSCKMTFPTKQGISQHMSKKHSDIPPHMIGQLVSSVENVPNADTVIPELSTPPPAHSMTKSQPKPSLDDIDKATSSRLLKSYLLNKASLALPAQVSAPDIVEANKPLDFSTKKSQPDADKSATTMPVLDLTSSEEQDASISEDEPMDLSVSRPSTSSSLDKDVDNQTPWALLVPKIKKEPRSPNKTENTDNSNSSSSNNNNNNNGNNIADGNNNQISSVFPNPLEGTNLAIALSQSPKLGTTSDIPLVIPASHLPKHPAFPQFLPVILPPSPGRVNLKPKPNSIGSLAVADKVSVSPSGSQTIGIPAASSAGRMAMGRSLLSESSRHLQFMQPSVVLEELKKDGKKSEKGSSSGSESSCELASVNKMLDATDAQNFQDYLMIPETEDEQDSKSDSIESEEDSNMSMETMFSNSQSMKSALLPKISEKTDKLVNPKDSPEDSKKDGDDQERTVTVGMALMEGGIPATVFKDSPLDDSIEDDKIEIPDPNNMSEQAIAKLIEKVSRENASYPIKKKRNSYADSPHKFSCPYCPRCFPWLSSLNRHLLTHTGQKPFKCPRCPVTFSTKSNRERHLIRKHNVNMLDPASRSTMDRPYKCHLCVFSSFATQSNLIKHYKERHDGATPPLKALEAVDILDKSFSDNEMDDVNGKTCEEEEEEYAMTQMQSGTLSDRDLMLQNYIEEEDSQDSSVNGQSARDPHKKRNVIFDLFLDNEAAKLEKISAKNGLKEYLSLSNGLNGKSSSSKTLSNILTLPGIDETVLTDNMKAFLGKSIQQSLEDSQRKALEEGSTFNITPAIERHLRRLPKAGNVPQNQAFQCVKCDEPFGSKKQLSTHFKTHVLDTPFSCYLCELSFASRIECLQHQALAHAADWQALQEKNSIGNLAVFATRLDKGIIKICKKGKDIMDKLSKAKNDQEDLAKTKDATNLSEMVMEEVDEIEESNEQEDENENTASVSEPKDESNTNPPEDRQLDNFLNEVLSTDYLQRKIHCALCPQRFWSQQELKCHMKKHTDTSGKTSSGMKIPENIQSTKNSAQQAGDQSMDKSDAKNGQTNKEKGNADILHNLLGVESSTIDQIFESKDSAASLLGFSQNSQS